MAVGKGKVIRFALPFVPFAFSFMFTYNNGVRVEIMVVKKESFVI